VADYKTWTKNFYYGLVKTHMNLCNILCHTYNNELQRVMKTASTVRDA